MPHRLLLRWGVVAATAIAIGCPALTLATSSRSPWPAAAVLLFVPAVLGPSALVTSMLSMLRQRRRQPARLEVSEDGTFVVPSSMALALYAVGGLLLCGALATIAAAGGVLTTVTIAPTALLMITMAGGTAVAALRNRPRIELTPSLLRIRLSYGERTVPWEALEPGLPWRSTDLYNFTLTVRYPELVGRRGLPLTSRVRPTVNLGYARVHPWFLADAIRFYVDHPERRDEIGTTTEYERLIAELSFVPA